MLRREAWVDRDARRCVGLLLLRWVIRVLGDDAGRSEMWLLRGKPLRVVLL